uniref:hypothetical protein n=1 Tax=Pseudonocardia sp. CA-138482 TaxID=3240023 RepID=UPI003F499592
MDQTSVYAEIVKTAPQADGSLLVYGKATGSDLDLDQQRCDPAWLKRAMPAWFTVGNIREQHDPRRAVGKATEYEAKADGHYITAKIVDQQARDKVEAKVFTGFSIGIKNPRISKSADAPNGTIDDGDICEISLVDRPCLPTATLTVCKAATPGWEGAPADLDEERGLVRCEDLKVAEPGEPQPEADVAKTEAPAEPAEPEAEKTADPDLDREAAKALIAATLEKAGADVPPVYDDEQSDILNAQSAISIISKLIVSEATEMINNPAEDCDIQILLSAVSALRCFIGREQQQSLGENDAAADASPDVMLMAAEPDAEKAKYSADQLRKMLKDGQAVPNAAGDPSFPIADGEDLDNAISAVGRSGAAHDDVRKYIIGRAKALGQSSKIPDSWSSSGANGGKAVEPETAEPETAKTVDPDTTKATAVDAPAADPDALVKALTSALEKADNPLRTMFVGLIEAATQTTAQSVSELTERLVKVEQMPIPGGPALRRTEAERAQARKADLLARAAQRKTQAQTAEDLDLRRGYAAQAAQLEAQAKAL